MTTYKINLFRQILSISFLLPDWWKPSEQLKEPKWVMMEIYIILEDFVDLKLKAYGGRPMWCSDWGGRPWDRIQGIDTRLSQTLWWGGDILIGLDLLGVLEVSGIRGVFSELGGASSGEYASTTITLVTVSISSWNGSSVGRGERTSGRGRLRTQDTKLLTTNFVSTLTKSWMSKFPILIQETQF